MKKTILVAAAMMTLGMSLNAKAEMLNGDPARELFAALMQADLPPTNTTAPDKNFPGQTDIVDQKVTATRINCDMRYDEIGTLLGSCTLRDVHGKALKLGSAASAQILKAVPNADGATGHFTASEKAVTCEIDIRKMDSTGTAVATCNVQD